MTARREWVTMWPLPLTAMFGVSGGVVVAYSSSAFMETMTAEFGWSRFNYSLVFSFMMVVGVFAQPLAGRLADRYGPRRVALAGIIPAAIGMALLGLVGKPIWQWWVLGVTQSTLTAMIVPTIWITAVVGRFRASRGLALATALAGTGFAAALYPPLASFLIEVLGWREAWLALGLLWGAIALPLTFFFFRGPRDLIQGEKTAVADLSDVEGAGLMATLKSRSFVFLALAGGLSGGISFGYNVHLIPMIRSAGLDMTTAASIAGAAGLFSIAGRFTTGFLLDRLPTRPLAIAVFTLPILVGPLIWVSGGSIPVLILAVAFLGAAAGAEFDIIFYVASREFPQQYFASICTIISAFFAICAGIGPLIGGAIFDRTGEYSLYFVTTCPAAIAAGLLIAMMPRIGGHPPIEQKLSR